MFARKTAAGHAELGERTLKLDLFTRRLLILIDGDRNRDQLQAFLGSHDIGPMLEQLVEHGLIEGDVSGGSGTAPVNGAAATPHSSSDSTGGALPARSAKELEMGRNFIINTLSTFTGPYAHADLMSEALKAPDQASLRELIPRWREALTVATKGKRLDELEQQLLKVI
ncbi:MAG: hypothetical protein KDI51_09085 [Xanthomonadales bacterium]|nr:hypothetical protein [Xanthomonadales bacterium]